MNELIQSHSPYLLQHAQNPVHWKMWSEEAFELAKKENKPVLVSIGYATCHWCHVMERESFENEEIANWMNANFICIKVDREELPHVDKFYMDALLSMEQQGGWPLNVFTTADKKPFFGGTYFPPTPMYHKPSWRQILDYILQLWNEKMNDVTHQSEMLTKHLETIQKKTLADTYHALKPLDYNWLKTAFLEKFDWENGGWHHAPKFPQFLLLNNLVLHYANTKDKDVYQAIQLFWNKMISNGLYDSTEGGIFRYAVDAEWSIPHFEKMLYDNVLFIEALCITLRYTDLNYLEKIIREQIHFLQENFLSKNGLYITAYDADSDGVEGLYYLLDEKEFSEFHHCNFPENYLHVVPIYHGEQNFFKINLEILCKENDENIFSEIKKKLIDFRIKKTKPQADTKEILSLNALANKAITLASEILHDNTLLNQAKTHFSNIQKHFFKDKEVKRVQYESYSIQAQSDDIVFYLDAAMQLGLWTGEKEYWDISNEALSLLRKRYLSNENGFLTQVSESENDIPIVQYESMDNIIPSSNSVYAYALKLLGIYNADLTQIQEANQLVERLYTSMIHYPQAYSRWIYHYEFIRNGSLIKVYSDEKESYFDEFYRKFGINQIISKGSFDENQKNKNSKIVIQQCFEDRCIEVFRGKRVEFEK